MTSQKGLGITAALATTPAIAMRRHPLKSCLANTFFALLVLPLLIACTSATTPSPVPARVAPGQQTATAPLHELSVHELLAGYRDGSLTAEAVTAHFLARIDRIDPAVNALIETNPQALAQARFHKGGRNRPLFGCRDCLCWSIEPLDLQTK